MCAKYRPSVADIQQTAAIAPWKRIHFHSETVVRRPCISAGDGVVRRPCTSAIAVHFPFIRWTNIAQTKFRLFAFIFLSRRRPYGHRGGAIDNYFIFKLSWQYLSTAYWFKKNNFKQSLRSEFLMCCQMNASSQATGQYRKWRLIHTAKQCAAYIRICWRIMDHWTRSPLQLNVRKWNRREWGSAVFSSIMTFQLVLISNVRRIYRRLNDNYLNRNSFNDTSLFNLRPVQLVWLQFSNFMSHFGRKADTILLSII